jgi:hypothetical protein
MATQEAVASNRGTTSPKTPRPMGAEIGMGIDKLAFSLEISKIIQNKTLWDRMNPQFAEAHDYLTMNTSLHIKARRIGSGLRCVVEYNPSRIVDPYGHSLCRIEELFYTVGVIVHQLTGRVEIEGDVTDALVRRLDVARDFRVADPQFYLTGLRPLHRRNGANPSLWYDEKSGAASSLRVGTSRLAHARHPNHVTLYDKGLKAGTPETKGVLRWEMEGRTWTERYGDIKTLADLTPARINTLAVNRWDWSRMGEVGVSEHEFVDHVWAADWLSVDEKVKFVGEFFAVRYGKRVFEGRAREKFNRIQKALAVTLSCGTAMRRKLDFLTCTEITEASEAA